MDHASGLNPLEQTLDSPVPSPHDAATIISPEYASDSCELLGGVLAREQLVFGIIALQSEFLSRGQLVAAFDTWARDKSCTLPQILETQGVLSQTDRQLTELLTARFIQKHGGRAETSLDSLAALATIRHDLEGLNDSDLSACLANMQIELSPKLAALNANLNGGFSTDRFTILRPHAQGGLGQVSVALDHELNREVALKEIQPQYADNPVGRERFLVEAEITGSLEHPGIVPVYSLGRGAKGRPFYAMRFIKGERLLRAIDEFHHVENPQRKDPSARQITFRQLLSRFIAICNAIEYAHSRGVMHRDLKPANIMVGKFGETLVVDWGLAKSVDQSEIAAGETTLRPASGLGSSGQTLPGSVIGTLSYMSPEQAAGSLDQMQPATDVYCLGATLYHLLTGRPPLPKGDKEEMLARVQRGDFLPPRSILSEVPTGLEAICLKAMALKPDDRYRTTRALADDLEHWLADEPVSALPESRSQRAARWMRRHRAWAQAAAVALLAVTIVSIAAALLINQSRRSEQIALRAARDNEELALRHAEAARQSEQLAQANEDIARENAEAAKRNADLALQHAAKAKRSEDLAKNSALLAERNAQAAKAQYRQTVASMLNLGVQLQKRLQTQSRAADVPEVKALSRELLGTIGDNLLQLGKALQNSGVADFAMASAYDQMGELLLKLGHGAEALQSFGIGRRLIELVAGERPDDDVARANLALLTMKIGRTYLDVHDDAREGLKNFLSSCDLQREIMNHPRSQAYKPADNRRLLSMYEIQSGVAELRLGHPSPAQTHFQAALEQRRAWLEESPGNVAASSYCSECYLWLGTVAWHLGDAPGVESNFRECLRICNDLAERHPNDTSFLGGLAEIHGALGDAHWRLGKIANARDSYAKSHDYLRRLLDRQRDDVTSLPLLAGTLEHQALLAERGPDAAEAAVIYDQSRKIRDKMADLDPQNLSWLAARAPTLAHCGRPDESVAQVELLLRRTRESPSSQLQAARCFAVCSQAANDAGQKWQYIERALAAVAASVTADFDDPVMLATDPEFAALASEPAFQFLLKTIQERGAADSRRSDE